MGRDPLIVTISWRLHRPRPAHQRVGHAQRPGRAQTKELAGVIFQELHPVEQHRLTHLCEPELVHLGSQLRQLCEVGKEGGVGLGWNGTGQQLGVKVEVKGLSSALMEGSGLSLDAQTWAGVSHLQVSVKAGEALEG